MRGAKRLGTEVGEAETRTVAGLRDEWVNWLREEVGAGAVAAG